MSKELSVVELSGSEAISRESAGLDLRPFLNADTALIVDFRLPICLDAFEKSGVDTDLKNLTDFGSTLLFSDKFASKSNFLAGGRLVFKILNVYLYDKVRFGAH